MISKPFIRAAKCGVRPASSELLNVQPDHVHLLVKVPPKISISQLMGTVKGRVALQVFQKFPQLRTRRYWGNHFWAAGYCVDTVGIDAEIIQKYVKYQEDK